MLDYPGHADTKAVAKRSLLYSLQNPVRNLWAATRYATALWRLPL